MRAWRWLTLLAACLALPAALGAEPGARARGKSLPGAHQFGVIVHPFREGNNDAMLKQALLDSGPASLAFLVATGIKAASEPCSDKLYAQRKQLLDQAPGPVIVSLAASDWIQCKSALGRSAAIERLNRLRETFFDEPRSLGERKIALARLSASAKFRSYAENAHWQYGRILYATINLPADNNHYLPEAGRNSEFEDRQVANRAWLKRLFLMAQRKNMEGIVLFSDADLGLGEERDDAYVAPGLGTQKDGFAETRRQISTLAPKFHGKLLLIDAQGTPKPNITWHGKLGHLTLNAGALTVRVNPGSSALFTLKPAPKSALKPAHKFALEPAAEPAPEPALKPGASAQAAARGTRLR